MDWLIVIMAGIALAGVLIAWVLHCRRIRLLSIGMVLLGLIASLFLYSRVYIFGNWWGALMTASALFLLAALVYLLLVSHMLRQEKRALAVGAPVVAAALHEPMTVAKREASQSLVANKRSLPELCRAEGPRAVLNTDSAAAESQPLAAVGSPKPQAEAADAVSAFARESHTLSPCAVRAGVAQTAAGRQALAKTPVPETPKKNSICPASSPGRAHPSGTLPHSAVSKEELQASHIRSVPVQPASEPAMEAGALFAALPAVERVPKIAPPVAPEVESISEPACEPAFVPEPELQPEPMPEPVPQPELEIKPNPELQPEPVPEAASAPSFAQAMARLNILVAAHQYQAAQKQIFFILQSGYHPTPEDKQRLLLIMRLLKEREK